ncbi:MAG: hypothetical protein CL916_10515 [Deltaproteobacteria bacterium]|nr:hypothetical protein [Deltaproteobacteria bacterium]
MSKMYTLFNLVFLSVIGSGCTNDSSNDAICGGNGEIHDGHCHCDDGFTISEDGNSCEESQESNYGGDFIFSPSNVQASTGISNNDQIWLLEAMDGDSQLKIEIYESYGGISSPGSITINDVESNYATCGTCVLLQTGCVEHGNHYDCSSTYMPMEGGEIHIEKTGTNAGDDFAGQLLGVVFQEVRISQDYETEPVSGGTQLELAPWSFETQLDEL